MANFLQLRFTAIKTSSGIYYDSNLVKINGPSGVHIEMAGNGNEVTSMQSLTGQKFVSCYQDYFGDIFDKIIPHPGIGQIMKFRVNRMPQYAVCIGNIEDMGDIDPNDPENIVNGFAGSEGEYFRGSNSEYLVGKHKT